MKIILEEIYKIVSEDKAILRELYNDAVSDYSFLWEEYKNLEKLREIMLKLIRLFYEEHKDLTDLSKIDNIQFKRDFRELFSNQDAILQKTKLRQFAIMEDLDLKQWFDKLRVDIAEINEIILKYEQKDKDFAIKIIERYHTEGINDITDYDTGQVHPVDANNPNSIDAIVRRLKKERKLAGEYPDNLEVINIQKPDKDIWEMTHAELYEWYKSQSDKWFALLWSKSFVMNWNRDERNAQFKNLSRIFNKALFSLLPANSPLFKQAESANWDVSYDSPRELIGTVHLEAISIAIDEGKEVPEKSFNAKDSTVIETHIQKRYLKLWYKKIRREIASKEIDKINKSWVSELENFFRQQFRLTINLSFKQQIDIEATVEQSLKNEFPQLKIEIISNAFFVKDDNEIIYILPIPYMNIIPAREWRPFFNFEPHGINYATKDVEKCAIVIYTNDSRLEYNLETDHYIVIEEGLIKN